MNYGKKFLIVIFQCFYVIGKIQSLRTTFREEIRKIKKSQGTGSGAADVYVPKWRYFEECSFLENVICSNRPCLSNMSASSSNDNDDDSMNLETAEDEFSLPSPDNDSPSAHPKKRKKVPWMETAATALSELAKEAKESKETTSSNLAKEEDEWDVFGRDVANSIRALGNSDWQRRVKFAVQTAIFQTTEQQRAPPHYAAYNVQENNGGLNYHNLLPPGN